MYNGAAGASGTTAGVLRSSMIGDAAIHTKVTPELETLNEEIRRLAERTNTAANRLHDAADRVFGVRPAPDDKPGSLPYADGQLNAVRNLLNDFAVFVCRVEDAADRFGRL